MSKHLGHPHVLALETLAQGLHGDPGVGGGQVVQIGVHVLHGVPVIP